MKRILLLITWLPALCALADLDKSILMDEEKLIEVVKKAETSDNDKVTACQNLGHCGKTKAIATLQALLNDEKAHIRHAARYGLEMIPDPAVENVLNEAAGKLNGPALVGVLQSMGNRGNAKSVEILTARMNDGDKAVGDAAVNSLGKLATPEAMAALRKALGSNSAVTEAYLTATAKLASTNAAEAAACYAAVRKTADNVTPTQRLAALRGEIVTGGDAALPLWQDALASTDQDTVNVALRAVLDVPSGAKATEIFAAALATVPETQSRLATVLGQRGDKVASPALLALATGKGAKDKTATLAAASALAALNDPVGIPPILALAKDPDGAVAEEAKRQLTGFAGKAADDAALALMADPSPETRLSGIDIAMRRRMAAAVPSLVKLTADPDLDVATAAVKGLGSLGTDKEIPALLTAIKKAPEDQKAVRALSDLCKRYARPRAGKTVIKSAVYGSFKHNQIENVTNNVQKLVDAGSITIQSSGRLCRWDGFSKDPAPGIPKLLRLVYTFDGVERSVEVREGQSVHLSGEVLVPAAMSPIMAAYDAATDGEKLALFKVLTSLGNAQGLEVARAAAKQTTDAALQEAAIRAIADWKTPEALEDAAVLARTASNDRLKILSLRGFIRQLEMSFTIPLEQQLERLKEAQTWAVRDEDRTLVADAIAVTAKLCDEQGFKPMFNGVDLSEWSGGDGWWSVKDGILQAQSSEDKPCTKTCHLIWKGGEPGDFEMRCEFRLSPHANSGVQIRAENQVHGDSGYQADMNGAGNYVGYLYHPAQHLVGERGARVVINEKGEKTVERFADSADVQKKVFQDDNWNTYRIVCKGPSIKLYVNGMLTTDFEDHRPATPRKGFITLQMHQGKPMKIQFRNLVIKSL